VASILLGEIKKGEEERAKQASKSEGSQDTAQSEDYRQEAASVQTVSLPPHALGGESGATV
jgi:hypothetical protein